MEMISKSYLSELDADALDQLLAVLTEPEVLDRYDHIFLAMVDHDDAMAVLGKHKAVIDQLIQF